MMGRLSSLCSNLDLEARLESGHDRGDHIYRSRRRRRHGDNNRLHLLRLSSPVYDKGEGEEHARL